MKQYSAIILAHFSSPQTTIQFQSSTKAPAFLNTLLQPWRQTLNPFS